jgi:hypothetical protein
MRKIWIAIWFLVPLSAWAQQQQIPTTEDVLAGTIGQMSKTDAQLRIKILELERALTTERQARQQAEEALKAREAK